MANVSIEEQERKRLERNARKREARRKRKEAEAIVTALSAAEGEGDSQIERLVASIASRTVCQADLTAIHEKLEALQKATRDELAEIRANNGCRPEFSVKLDDASRRTAL